MKINGVLPALITPLNQDERINLPVLKKMLQNLLSQGADGFYIGGATGEGINLRTEERMILAEESVKTVNGKKPCIVQVASTNFNDVIALAKQAEECGADMVSSTAPIFFAYNEENIYNYYKAIANAVNIPVMVYYCPLANFNFTAKFVAKLFEIDNITAIKWTSSDYYGITQVKDLTHGEMTVMNGPDEMMLMGLCAGADGAIGSNYNYIYEDSKAIYSAFVEGDIKKAQEAQYKLNRFVNLLLKDGEIIPTIRALLEAQGYDVGDATFPLTKFTAEQKANVVDEFRKIGLKF